MHPELAAAVGCARARSVARRPVVESLDAVARLLPPDDRPALLVIDPGVAAAGDADANLLAAMDDRRVEVFSAFTVTPTSSQAVAAASMANACEAGVIVAMGGGAAIDVAKAAALGAAHRADPAGVIEGRASPTHHALPLVAIPTTAGTGSEATHFAVVYVHGVKRSLAHPSLLPSGVVMDVGLSTTCPASVAAAAGLDALCQAIESLWAVGADDRSRADARLAGRIAATSLADAVGGCLRGRTAMMWASHLAGHAINVSRTTAPHAASYAMSARHGVPHGIAVALTIGHFARGLAMMDERTCVHQGGVEAVRGLVAEAASWLGSDAEGLVDAVASLARSLGVPDSLRAAGIPREAIEGLASAADPLRLSNHPQRLDEAAIARTLRAAW